MKKNRIMAAVIVVLLLVAACETICLAMGRGGTGDVYQPALCVIGDVENTVSLRCDGGKYLLTVSAGEEGSSDGQTECETHDFTFEDEKHSGILLSDVIQQAELASGESHIWFAGFDGMMSSVEAAKLEENYLVFGANGWEMMNVDYPASSNVKEMEYIAVVADDPSTVPAAVTVTDDGGYERVLSPGTLFLEETVSSRKYHGQSEKSGKSVVVFTTDTWVEIGGERLTLDGNRIVKASDVQDA